MLDYLGWETHESRRTKLQLTVFYKIVHDLIAIPHSRYLTPASKKTRAGWAAHSFKFQQYPTSTDCFKFSFFPRTIPVWNRLPAAAAEAPSLISFKGSWEALPSKWGFLPGHEVNLNDKCWVVPSGLVPRYPQGRWIGHTQIGESCWVQLSTTSSFYLIAFSLSDCNYTSHFYFFLFSFTLGHH